MDDDNPNIWPPPPEVPTERQTTPLVRGERLTDANGRNALIVSGIGFPLALLGLFIHIMPLGLVGWPFMLVGFVMGVCNFRSREGKIAVLIPVIAVVYIGITLALAVGSMIQAFSRM